MYELTLVRVEQLPVQGTHLKDSARSVFFFFFFFFFFQNSQYTQIMILYDRLSKRR